jgi:hypothetical protein
MGPDLGTADLGVDDLGPSVDLIDIATLTLNIRGTGAGTVSVDGVPYAATAMLPIMKGTPVTLVPAADSQSTFVAFTGACTAATQCSFTTLSDATMTANFKTKASTLTIVPVGLSGGAGTVTVTGTTGSCGANCYTYVDGAMLTLVPNPNAGSFFLGFGGAAMPACRGALLPCRFAASGDIWVTVSFSGVPLNYVFVTAATQTVSQLTQFAAKADDICRSAAQASLGFPSSNQFRAWISDGNTAAAMRLVNSRGWVRLDGLPFADRPTALAPPSGTPAILYPVLYTETGAVNQNLVWTGSLGDGTTLRNCMGWGNAGASASADVGRSGDVSASWTADQSLPCSGSAALYCFDTAANNPLTLDPLPGGRLAFVTAAGWTPGSLGKVDTLCAMEASAAGLGGSFGAYLNTSATAGLLPFDLTLGPWARPDHVLVAAVPAATQIEAGGLAPPSLTAAGTLTTPTIPGWTGNPMANCVDWSSTAVGDQGAATSATLLGGATLFPTCNTSSHLFCLQR